MIRACPGSRLAAFAALVGCCALQLPAPIEAQTPGGVRSLIGKLPIALSGNATTTGEVYRHGGGTARRPASSWRLAFSPQASLFGEFGMSVELLLSSEGSQLRQNVNQVGLNPSWRWVTLHAGDFSKDLSEYTVSGTRLRGGGFDLKPGMFEFSLQAGRAQRTVARDDEGGAYQRNMLGVAAGFGRPGSNRIRLTMLKAKDDPNSLEQSLVIVDTTFADTALVPQQPRFATTPQENLVVAIQAELSMFEDAIHLAGEVGAALFTRDLRSRTISDEELGGLGAISGLQPVRVSTSGDLAYRADADVNLGRVGLRGGYEEIGPGYTSLGLPTLISDQKGYNLGGNVALLGNRLALQGETRTQRNNLVDQRAARTDRSTHNVSAVFMLSQSLTTSVTGVLSTASTPGSELSPAVDAHALALSTTVAAGRTIAQHPTMLSIAYGFQRSDDRVPNTVVPTVTSHNLTASLQTALSPRVSLGPTLSAVTSSQSGAAESQQNLLLGFMARAKLMPNQQLVTSANVSNTFSGGRKVMNARADASYELPWDTRVQLQARHVSYSAFANRPAFNESFMTMTLSRSFSAGR